MAQIANNFHLLAIVFHFKPMPIAERPQHHHLQCVSARARIHTTQYLFLSVSIDANATVERRKKESQN